MAESQHPIKHRNLRQETQTFSLGDKKTAFIQYVAN